MAESTGRETRESKDYGKSTQKFITRALEKVMHKVGKSDKTADEDFDKLAQSFNEQQAAAVRLNKELKAYVVQVKVMTTVTQNLYNAMRDVYEIGWKKSQEFYDCTEKLPALQTSLLNELNDKVLTQLNSYTSQFPPMKERISKRGRKLVDYDAARHNVQSLENSKKRNDFKVTQAHEEMQAAKAVYDNINHELLSELPRLYDSRIASLCSCIDLLLSTELDFSEQMSSIKKEMAEIASGTCTSASSAAAVSLENRSAADRNANTYVSDSDLKSFQRLSTPDEISRQPVLTGVNARNGNTSTQCSRDSSNSVYSEIDVEEIKLEQKQKKLSDAEGYEKQVSVVQLPNQQRLSMSPTTSSPAEYPIKEPLTNGSLEDRYSEPPRPSQPAATALPKYEEHQQQQQQQQSRQDAKLLSMESRTSQQEEDLFSEQMLQQKQQEDFRRQQQQQQPKLGDQDRSSLTAASNDISDSSDLDAATSFLSSEALTSDFFAAKKNAMAVTRDTVLHSVVATNPYTAEDDEELNLEPGHVINVLEPRAEDEPLDEGWLMGFNTATGARGLFPANFTKPL